MLTEICVDAVLAIKPADEKTALDLHMVEIMEMQHRSEQVNLFSFTRTLTVVSEHTRSNNSII
jgi:hypothetical protein